MAAAQRFGRPGVPADQAWIESLFSHIKADWPHLEKIRDPGELEAELARIRDDGCTPASATSPPTTSTLAAERKSAKPVGTASKPHARHASPTEPDARRTSHDPRASPVGYFLAELVH